MLHLEDFLRDANCGADQRRICESRRTSDVGGPCVSSRLGQRHGILSLAPWLLPSPPPQHDFPASSFSSATTFDIRIFGEFVANDGFFLIIAYIKCVGCSSRSFPQGIEADELNARWTNLRLTPAVREYIASLLDAQPDWAIQRLFHAYPETSEVRSDDDTADGVVGLLRRTPTHHCYPAKHCAFDPTIWNHRMCNHSLNLFT
jgi:hypothetical protein